MVFTFLRLRWKDDCKPNKFIYDLFFGILAQLSEFTDVIVELSWDPFEFWKFQKTAIDRSKIPIEDGSKIDFKGVRNNPILTDKDTKII